MDWGVGVNVDVDSGMEAFVRIFGGGRAWTRMWNGSWTPWVCRNVEEDIFGRSSTTTTSCEVAKRAGMNANAMESLLWSWDDFVRHFQEYELYYCCCLDSYGDVHVLVLVLVLVHDREDAEHDLDESVKCDEEEDHEDNDWRDFSNWDLNLKVHVEHVDLHVNLDLRVVAVVVEMRTIVIVTMTMEEWVDFDFDFDFD